MEAEVIMKHKFMRKMMAAVLATTVMLTGCGSTESGNTNTTANNTETAAQNDGDADAKDPVLFDGKDTEIVMYFPGANSNPTDLHEVEDSLNALLADRMDGHIKIQILEWGAYADQYNLMLSSGEEAGLIFAPSGRYRTYASKGQLTPITDLYEKYAPTAATEMSKYIEACYYGDDLYGLPTFRNMAQGTGFVCRKDLLDETGISIDDVKTWDDVEKVLIAVQEKHPDMDLLCNSLVKMGILDGIVNNSFDEIQSGVGQVYGGDSSKVVNIYATDKFKEICDMAYDWNQKGYFMKDATTNADARTSLIAAGNTFGYIVGTMYPGFLTQETSSCGYEMVGAYIGDAVLSTYNAGAHQWLVPAACPSPEKALTVLEMLYSDPAAQNLFYYGIEGKDYVVKDEANGLIGYPDGVDSSTVGWSNQTWITGNGSIAYVWETEDPDVWQELKEFNDNAVLSPLYGFSYDSSNVTNEITAITNVEEKYLTILKCGAADVDSTLEQFLAELETAGIQNVINDVQAQMDSWNASQK